MKDEEFWLLVDAAHDDAEDAQARVDALRRQLSALSAAQLQSFQNCYDEKIRRAYRWDLWAAAYIINGGCSDDGFRYFRDWLISEGRATFERAMGDPQSLADLPHAGEADLEPFGYVALELYDAKGLGELDRDFSTEGAEPAGESWSEDAVDDLFPRLAAKYG